MIVSALVWVAPIGPSPTSASAPAQGPSVAGATSEVSVRQSPLPMSPRRVDLADGAVWPGGVVTWHAKVPERYRWSVNHGVRAWNRTHTGIRLVRAPRSEADLRISLGDTEGAAATATVGRQRHAQNSILIQRAPISGWADKQVYGRVVAHELGHVLGLRHSSGLRCGLMEAALDAACTPATRDGRYYCRWVGSAVGENIVARYGGEFRLGPRWCRLRPRSS